MQLTFLGGRSILWFSGLAQHSSSRHIWSSVLEMQQKCNQGVVWLLLHWWIFIDDMRVFFWSLWKIYTLNPLRATHSFWRLIFLHSGWWFCYQSRILRLFLSPMGDFKAPLKSTGRGDIPRTPVDSWGEKSCSCRDENVCWTSHLPDSWQKSCISWYLIPDFSDRTNSPLWSPIAKFHPYPERSPLGAKL